MSTPAEGGGSSGSGNLSGDQVVAVQAAIDQQLRELATTMNQMVQKAVSQGFAIRKAIITSVNALSTPPSVELNISGDTESPVDQVRMVNNFNPQVGQTVLLAKQGSEIFILGAIAASSGKAVGPVDTGWKRATLAAGSHNGNSNGDVYYRRVLDNGSWKMQWRGGWNVSGTTMITGLDQEYRPSSKRTIDVPRDAGGGSNVAKIDFNSDGTAVLVGGTTSPGSTGGQTTSGSSPGGSTSSANVTISIGVSGTTSNSSTGTNHTHTFSDTDSGSDSHSHSVSVNNHTHQNGNHSHPVDSPTWVSLNKCEYFL
ncbi:hypothetical protein ACWD2L_05800 [Streptomyces sp. NPDC002754]